MLVNRKIKNIESVIILLSLFSNLSIMPSLKITVGKTARSDIITIIMTMQNVLIISASVKPLVGGNFWARI